MSYECNECGRDLRQGHSEYCSRWRPLQDHPEEKLIGRIDVEPTWESLLPMLMNRYLDGSVESSELAWAEMEKMARAADAYRALQKNGALAWLESASHTDGCVKSFTKTEWTGTTTGKEGQPWACTCGLDQARGK